MLSVERDVLLKALDDGLVLVEKHRAVCALEAVQASLGCGPRILRNDGFDLLLRNVPNPADPLCQFLLGRAAEKYNWTHLSWFLPKTRTARVDCELKDD